MKKIKSIPALFLLLFLGCVMIWAQTSHVSNKNQKKPIVNMTYQAYWNKVDSLQKKGLTKSAYELSIEIYAKAKKENNSAQMVKAIIHRMKFSAETDEESSTNDLRFMETELQTAVFPVKEILHSMMAESYWNYYESHRYEILNRSRTINFNNDDMLTWDLNKFAEKSLLHYDASVSDEKRLQQYKINSISEIITEEKKSTVKGYRSTLYDFLMHRALDFYKNNEANLNVVIEAFVIENKDFYLPTKTFTSLAIAKNDTGNFKHKALLAFQKLEKFHGNDSDATALVDVVLERYEFIHDNANLNDSDSHYISAMQNLIKDYQSWPIVTDVYHGLAEFYRSAHYALSDYSSGPERKTNYLRIAHEYCNQAIALFPASRGGNNCKILKSEIESHVASFQTEQMVPSGKPSLLLLTTKNISEINVRIANSAKYLAERDQFNYKWDKKFLALPVVQQWKVALTKHDDFISRSTEISIPALPVGRYMIFISEDEDFVSDNDICFSDLVVSNLGLTMQPSNAAINMRVNDRTTGQPINAATIKVYENKYSYGRSKYEKEYVTSLVTDKDGFATYSKPQDEKSHQLVFDVFKDNDSLISKSHSNYYGRNQESNDDVFFTNFFLDRAIYRPGQTVYFKGICLKSSNKKYSIVKNRETTVTMNDANGQEVSKQTFVTNEYGSFNGSFVLPATGLTGDFRIYNNDGVESFSVEEYKRPTFEITFDTLNIAYKLGDSVSVKGKVMAFAGYGLDGARIAYTVTKNNVYMPWYDAYSYRSIPAESFNSTIDNDTVITNADGSFEIKFKAIGDANNNNILKYNFSIDAAVTDINGEVQNGNTSIVIGVQSVFLSMNLNRIMNVNSKNEAEIVSENANGNFIPAKGNIKIYKLKNPSTLKVERYWEMADENVIDDGGYRKQYPFYPNKKLNDEKGEVIWQTTFNTNEKKKILLPDMSSWEQDKYFIEAITTEPTGKEISSTDFFYVFNPDSKKPSQQEFLFVQPLKTEGKPGEKISMIVGSAYSHAYILQELFYDGKSVSRQWLELKNEQRKIEIQIPENFKTGMTVSFSMMAENRSFAIPAGIDITMPDDQLKITYSTFRSKLNPGQKEEWRIKISGPNGEKAASEILTSMYDASLDQFRKSSWRFNLSSQISMGFNAWVFSNYGIARSQLHQETPLNYGMEIDKVYESLNWFGYSNSNVFAVYDKKSFGSGAPASMGNVTLNWSFGKNEDGDLEKSNEEYAAGTYDSVRSTNGNSFSLTMFSPPKSVKTVVRKNFNETAFFFPQLKTDANGDAMFSFTVPESVTRWNFRTFAYNQLLQYVNEEKEVITQKDLMVQTNLPRFIRMGDTIELPAKVVNLSDKSLTAEVQLELLDAVTMQPLSSIGESKKSSLNIDKGSSNSTSWKIIVPENAQAIICRVTATSGDYSDGEEFLLPVLTNRTLVTESMPFHVRQNQQKTFSFEKLIHSNSSTLKNHSFSIEYTGNPAWYAVQALPYLMEFPHECNEQIFSRYYANCIAEHIVNRNEKIKNVFEVWRSKSPDAFLSALEKNESLKLTILENTPWLLEAKEEGERKRRVAVLFDVSKMAAEKNNALEKLFSHQSPDGSWPWFPGGPDNRYITLQIIQGMAHLRQLGVINNDEQHEMIDKAIAYLDRCVVNNYEEIKRLKLKPDENHLDFFAIQYLYMRSFFSSGISGKTRTAYDYYMNQEKKYWLSQGLYAQGMMAITQHRASQAVAKDIIKSLKEKAIVNDEMGMYWKSNVNGYRWNECSIETQAMMIEAFNEVEKNNALVEELKLWLIKNKQSNNWKTTKATAEACYALLLQGNVLSSENNFSVAAGSHSFNSNDASLKTEAGTGYFSHSWTGNDITASLGNISVDNKNEVAGYGAAYWQYFEDLDKITTANAGLVINKKLFIEKPSATGKTITPVSGETKIQIGDRVVVRMEIRNDREMDYVMLRDMRASGLEPVNVLSEYKYQDGLGYYESTRDASTNFYFESMPKGVFVFEYTLKATQAGKFSNGIAEIQCMYAPEFSAHSDGIRTEIVK